MTKIFQILSRIYPHTSYSRKLQMIAVILVTFLASFAEILSIGAVIPFITALQSPDVVIEQLNDFLPILSQYLASNGNIQFNITILFCAAIFLAMTIRLFLVFISARFSFGLATDLSTKMMRLTLHQSYQTHLNRNSSEVIAAMTTKTNSIVYSSIIPAILLFNSFVTVSLISLALIFLNPAVGISAILFFSSIYLVISWVAGSKLKRQSKIIADYQNTQIKFIQEGLGGIRDVILSNLQDNIIKNYNAIDKNLRRAHGNNQIIGLSPRFLLEGIGIVVIALVAFYLSANGDYGTNIVPLLGAYALAAQRLLPAMQSIYVAWANVSGDQDAVIDALAYLEQKTEPCINANKKIHFNNNISFKNISFKYETSDELSIKDVTLDIKKGDRVGIYGKTGSGKSTFVDILMGLNMPTIGEVLVDDMRISKENIISWQKNIAHVPQRIFLIDGSIAENVAFGVPENQIDFDKVNDCLAMASLPDFINNFNDKEFKLSGERGSKLSGGQIQRIAIARALYLNRHVIVFDEATSALDSNTEKEIMETIYKLDKDLTLIIIAHRLSTLDLCNKKFEFDNGSLK